MGTAACGPDGPAAEVPAATPVCRIGCVAVEDAGREASATGGDGSAATGADAGASDGGTVADGGDAARCPPCGPVHPLVARLAHLEEDWPRLDPATRLRSFSSFDRKGGNADGFDGRYGALRTADDGTFVIFDAEGPGALTTLWFTGAKDGPAGLDLGTVRFFFDGESAPRIELPWSELFSGTTPPFLAPLVSDRTVSSGGYVSWVPLPYRDHLVVTTSKKPYFYIAQYETHSPDADVETYAAPFPVEPLVARWRSVGDGAFTDGVPVVEPDATFAGPGTLEVLQVDLGHEPTAAELDAGRVRLWWEDATAPAVDVPLGAFFAAPLAGADVRAVPLTSRGGRFESRFVMPFWSSARLQVSGVDATVRARIGAARFAAEEAGHFHATFAEESPTTPGVDFTWKVPGEVGRLAGTVLTVRPVTPTTKKWWEGDLRSYVDGLRSPALQGTGHEDDHLGGWSNTFLSEPFSLPLHGEPATELLDLDGQYNANATMYRFYTGHSFTDGLLHGTEHGSRNGVSAGYSGVAYFYAREGTSVTETDALSLSDAAARTAHGYEVSGEAPSVLLESAFEGRDDRTTLQVTMTTHTGPATFEVTVDPAAVGCALRRVFDHAEGRQAARVSVDGAPVGLWYTAEANQSLRLAEADYFVPGSFLRGRARVKVTLDPPPAGPPWSAAEYRVRCTR